MEKKIADVLVDMMKEMRTDIRDVRDSQMRHSVILEKNTDSLDEHIRRTDLLERSLSEHKEQVSSRFNRLENPVKARRTIFKWIVGVGTISGVIWSVLKLYTEYILRF